MGEVLVLGEGGATVRRSTCALLTLARRLGRPAVVLDGPADPAAVAVLGRFGAETVHAVAAPAAGGHPTAVRVETLVELARRTPPAAILIASGRDGLEIAGRVAVRLDSGILSDVVDVVAGPDGPAAVQSVGGGSCRVESRVVRGVPILAVRTERVTIVPAPATPAVVPARMTFPGTVSAVRVVRRRPGRAPASPELPTAAVIVTGGRGVGSPEGFELVHRLADALGGVAGGSHTATELGWCPREALVDQVGAIVHPSLYLALGVSGSQRHLAGMRGAGTIVAINTDPAAPIFRLSDVGVVGDVRQVVPELLAEIERRRAQPLLSTKTVSEA